MNLEATVDAQLSAGLGAGPLLIAAALGFVLALVLLSVLPSLALFFVPASSSAEATQTKQLKQPDTATNPHKGEQQNEEGKEESGGHHLHEGKAKEVSCTEDDVTTDQEDVSSVAVEDHLPKAPLAMSPDNQRDGHQAHPPTNAVVIVTDPQDAPKTIDAHNNHNEDNDLDGDDENGTGLASSPSFPRVRTEPGLGVEAQQYQPPKLKPKPTLRRATVATTASSLEHASVADSLVPSPAPSIYSFLSSSSGGGVGGVSLGSSVSAVDSTSTAAAAASDPSPSLASASSYPPHTAVTIETSSPPTPSSSTSSSSSSSSSSSNLLAVASAHVRPTGRLVRGQSNFLEAVKLGQLRDSEATSSLPNPAVHQWWEMERLLEKEYATIEEKAFGVMMKLMPFRSGEGLKDPPKIVPNPYHGNRVVLSALEDALPEHDTTFYNASYIKKGQFIAASMPHNDLTRQDFWRMIYEQDSRLIVMLNLEDESHGDAYWPNELNRTTHYGPMAITKTEQMRMRFYESTVRKFTITRTDQPDAPAKQVLHVHNTVWPDKGIPENVEAFTDMVEYVKQEYEQLCENKTGPMTVHCFGGIGRTGSFLTCMICLLSIRENQEANVFNTVLNLRTDRAMMVQTKEQYKFCYRVVMELLSRSKRKALHRGLSGVLRRSSARKKPPFQDGFASAPSPRVTEL